MITIIGLIAFGFGVLTLLGLYLNALKKTQGWENWKFFPEMGFVDDFLRTRLGNRRLNVFYVILGCISVILGIGLIVYSVL